MDFRVEPLDEGGQVALLRPVTLNSVPGIEFVLEDFPIVSLDDLFHINRVVSNICN